MSMTNSAIPEAVNQRRRNNLYRYTLLAMASYQLPVGVAFLAKVFHIARYTYSVIFHAYILYIFASITALIIVRLKKDMTKKFIYFVLHYQVVFCIAVSAYLAFVMDDQRYLVPIGCLLILFFVFIQSTMLISFLAILAAVVVYLSISYIGITYYDQAGSFVGDVLYILIFVPVCIFIAYMSKYMQDQQKKIKSSNTKLKATHAELEHTHTQLETIHTELESQNERMLDSIRYAEMIQRSLLPGIERIKVVSTDSMFIWIPKDIVGGDIFYTYADPDMSLIALMDCTGHGVPGAFLTMIVYSEIRKIIMEDKCRQPSEILSRLNKAVKNVLHKNNQDANTDDGLDAAVCAIDHSGKHVDYAGARIPLFYVANGTVHTVNGDKQSIGYKDSDDDFVFTNHRIDVENPYSFYLKTDGFTDQLGGEKQLRFGTNRFKELIQNNYNASYGDQRKTFLQALITYQGDNEQMDDITLIGFHVS